MIEKLIDKQDSFEIIRDKLAYIVASEIANQKILASNENKEISLWDMKVYLERSNPWEDYMNDVDNTTPIINIWYDNSNFIGASSDTVERQAVDGIYNIDVYAVANSSNNVLGGHNPGDYEASISLQRAIKLVRNIIMSANYTYLDLRGLVWQRMLQSITTFQPQQDRANARAIIAGRLALKVRFNEYSPQYAGNVVELISTEFRRTEDGQIVIDADYQH